MPDCRTRGGIASVMATRLLGATVAIILFASAASALAQQQGDEKLQGRYRLCMDKANVDWSLRVAATRCASANGMGTRTTAERGTQNGTRQTAPSQLQKPTGRSCTSKQLETDA